MRKKNHRRRILQRIMILAVAIVFLAAVVTAVRFLGGRLFGNEKAAPSGSVSSGTTAKDTSEQSSSPAEGGTQTASDLTSVGISAADPAAMEAGADSTGAAASAAGTYADPAAGGADRAAAAVDSSETATDSSGTGADLAETEMTAGGEGATSAAAAEDGASSEEEEGPSYTETELEKGKAYLSSLEERTPVEMEVLIDEARASFAKKQAVKAYAAKREEYREMLSGDAVWESFRDFVFLGDSRVEGFEVYGFLPDERVLAGTGDTINAITEQLDTIRGLSPKYIFISYGINDIGIGFWPTAEEYASAFADRLDTLREAVPDAEIYVNSILPATEDGVAYAPVWGGLPEYSEAVRKMCEEKEICFIDNASLFEEHEDLYAGDGVHLQPDFYRYWGENQLLGIYDRQHDLLTFPGPEE